MDLIAQLVAEFGLEEFQIKNTLALFDEGATVPFIARYRKERTGSLDEIQVRDLQHRYTYYTELEARRVAIIESIVEQGKMTPELEERIRNTLSKVELEDLYLPYKPRRTTRAMKAKEAGLEPLADFLLELDKAQCDILAKAEEFINLEKEIDTPQKAICGAKDILAERLSDSADIRKWMRELAETDGFIVSAVKKDFEGQKSKYEMYYDYREKVYTMPSHRILAMLRGEREKILKLSLDIPAETAIAYLSSRLIKHAESAALPYLQEAVADSFERLLHPATETEIRKLLRDKADVEAIKVFGQNLEALLLAAPAGRKSVVGIDPGFRSGCKIAAVSDTGKFLENATIFPHAPQNDTENARAVLLDFIKRHNIELVAIGNGTASRETDEFVRAAINTLPAHERPISVIVSEAGASVYSASDVAIKEFRELDLTVRGAISIARRLQDPLCELVKIDPKSIGVGQYQHDVNQSRLKDSLDEVVESCVNRVGVDVNLASEELLKYVSGLNKLIAENIVNHRNKNGAFASRDDLLNVAGLGDKKFQLSAGFLRIGNAENPLDNSAVHPESYDIVSQIAQGLNLTIRELIGNTTVLRGIDKNRFVTADIGLPTITDILSELEKPGRDPRAEFKYAQFNEGITSIEHLKEGMILEGVITNVANFGAFIDIGVYQEGLIHISEMSYNFVSDPKKLVKVGDVVKVRVVKIDTELKRIALSMKLEPAPQEQSVQAPAQKPQSEYKPKTFDNRERGHYSAPRFAAPPKSAPAEHLQKTHSLSDLKSKFEHAPATSHGNAPLKTVKPKINIKRLLP